MTALTDIVIPFASLVGIVGLVWGAAWMLRGHKAVDSTNKVSIDTHKSKCDPERKTNATAIRALEDRALKLELGKVDKPK